MYDHMLIDSRNCLYRAIYAGLSDKNFMRTGHDFTVIFFRFMNSYLSRFKPKNVHFFWDSPKEHLWRKKILTEYKGGRIPKHVDIDKFLDRCNLICSSILPNMNCRMYHAEAQEADDLIYAFCKIFHRHNKILIVSSDSDFKQISYEYETVDIFNPLSKDGEVYPREENDLVEIKAFMGEKGDNIEGYDQIGPVRAENLAKNYQDRFVFFDTHDKKVYLRNRALIDLSLCPYMLRNMEWIRYGMATQKLRFDMKEINKAIQIYKVRGLSSEISKTILPFKFLTH